MLFGTECFEIEILKSIYNLFGCGFMDFIMPKISALGDGGFIWIICSIILICTKKYRKIGFLVLTGMLVGVILGNGILKNLIARPRPFDLSLTTQLQIAAPTDFSHPSGHTLSSFIAAFILAKADRRFGCAAILLASLIAFSRLYLFVHYPTDILGGIILAYIIFKTIFFVSNKTTKPTD